MDWLRLIQYRRSLAARIGPAAVWEIKEGLSVAFFVQHRFVVVSCPRNKHIFRCDQNEPPARREEGAYPERYVTDEQRSRRLIFIATLWAAASWLFFYVARSSRIDLDMFVSRALKNSQLTCGERHAYFGDRTPVTELRGLVVAHASGLAVVDRASVPAL